MLGSPLRVQYVMRENLNFRVISRKPTGIKYFSRILRDYMQVQYVNIMLYLGNGKVKHKKLNVVAVNQFSYYKIQSKHIGAFIGFNESLYFTLEGFVSLFFVKPSLKGNYLNIVYKRFYSGSGVKGINNNDYELEPLLKDILVGVLLNFKLYRFFKNENNKEIIHISAGNRKQVKQLNQLGRDGQFGQFRPPP